MYNLKEGEKRTIRVLVSRNTGSGDINLTTPQYRILDEDRVLIAGFDWAAAVWDETNDDVSALFDSTQVGLTAPGTYWMQFRGTIGTERYEKEVKVYVGDWGP